jgi:AT-binding transcription factor 1
MTRNNAFLNDGISSINTRNINQVLTLFKFVLGYDDCSKNLPLLDASSVPVKPILMCFLCKLSFGYSSSFLSHCLTEHSIDLTNDEKSALERNQNCSAIIQAAGKDKTPLLSFLDPVVKESRDIPIRPNRTLSPNSIKGLLSAALTQQGTESNHSALKGNALNSLLLPPPASSPHRSGSLSPSKMTAPPSLFPSLPSPFGNNLALSSNMSGALPSPSDDGSDGDIDRKQTNSQLSIPFHSSQGNAAIDAITGVPSLSVTSAANLFAENSNIQSSMLRNSLDLAMSRKDGSPTSLNNNFVGDGQRSPGLPPLTPLPGRSSSQSPMPQGFLGSAMGQLGNPANFPSNANMLQGNTIGACPEHMNGRQAGVDCSKCDIILNSSRMPGGIGWNAARNTCKTLKCPKCNWHYKYQETLEIHMKEKHPDSETNCIYCVTGQQHPRLARGETYTCGYKPYRCEVCNYSTTTKGNLSIHMQSDKHLNNMQELQNGVAVATQPDGSKLPQSPLGPLPRPPVMGPCMSPINLAALQKAKPSWRCDVCNYETNVARNLRIHMTSEKHTHNIMVLQQNVKHIQNMSQGNGNGGIGISQGSPSNIPTSGLLPPLFGLDPQQILQMQLGLGNVPGIPGPPSSQGGVSEKGGQSEAAMADLAYIQAVMMQMMTGGQFPPGPHPPEFGVNPLNNSGLPSPGLMAADSGISPDSLEPPPEPANENPKFLFNCCVCREFGCDSMEVMSQHLTADRTRGREHEVSIVIGGNFICKLCSYKTNLKANFQLHCKTDKHLQRLNHVNHIKVSGNYEC